MLIKRKRAAQLIKEEKFVSCCVVLDILTKIVKKRVIVYLEIFFLFLLEIK